jgi:hypothetical protein
VFSILLRWGIKYVTVGAGGGLDGTFGHCRAIVPTELHSLITAFLAESDINAIFSRNVTQLLAGKLE